MIDSFYMPWNTRQDIRELEFIGPFGSTIHFNENQKSWILETKSEQDTRGRSASPLVSFALGKHQWVIENDTVECGEDGSYMVDLKLTGCQDDEFTCDDGQCIKMEKRCDNLPNCRDKSDEVQCTLWQDEEGYNKRIPPIKETKGRVLKHCQRQKVLMVFRP